MRLTAHTPAVPDTQAHPGGACPSAPIRGASRVLGAGDLIETTPVDNYLPICMRRGSWRPERDSRLEISGHFNPPVYRANFGPNLMVVNRSRSIRRPMRRAPVTSLPPRRFETWTWQTPVAISSSGKARWQENFTPAVHVDSVRLRLLRGANPIARSVSDDLCLVGSGTQCTYRCRAQPDASGALYVLNSTWCVTAAGDAVSPIVTPTYVFDQLDAVPGRPQTVPMRWELRGVNGLPMVTDTAELEFNLLARMPRGAALRADHSSFDFSRVQSGSHSARLETLLRNDGDQTVRIERLTMVGAHPQDFTAQWPGPRRPVPLPVDISQPSEPGKPFSMRPSDSLAALPMIRIDSPNPDAFGVSRISISQGAFQLYGSNLQFQQGLLVALDSEFDFVAAAKREALALNPGLDPEASIIGGRGIVEFAQTLRQLPLLLAPGETARLSVTARPTALGERSATLRIDWAPTLPGSTAPPIRLPARARSVSAAILDVIPAAMSFPAGQASRWQRRLVINNVGESDGRVQSLSVVGRDRGTFTLQRGPATPFVLSPGAPVIVSVEANPPPCGGGFAEFEAELRIALPDGSALDVPLRSLCAH